MTIGNLDKIIRQTETVWLAPLMKACTRQFSETHLPSHDQLHHARVWNYAKNLVLQSAKLGMAISEKDITQLIIAVFFHDQGMSETTSKEHGKISRKLCKVFIQKCNIPPPDFFEKVLDAIENHDKKEYKKTAASPNEFEIQKFLNTADDLDAFGIIGAYRYLEIYLLRHVNANLLPEEVMTNMDGRYKHFTDNFGHCIPLVNAHFQRYLTSKNYFKDLNFQINRIGYSENVFLGPIGVANYIHSEILGNKKSIESVVKQISLNETDFYCCHFFEKLTKESDL